MPQVLLELGPRLQGEVHRLHDLVLENVALHTIGAWMLYDDAAGRRRLNCVPVGFNDGPVQLGGRGVACCGRAASGPAEQAKRFLRGSLPPVPAKS